MQTADDIEDSARRHKQNSDFATALELRLRLEQLIVDCDADRRSKNYNWIAFLAVRTGDLQNAVRAARQSLELYSSLVGQPDARLATYTFMLACALASAGQYDEAVSYGERGIELYEKTGHDPSYVGFRRRDVARMRERETGVYLDRT